MKKIENARMAYQLVKQHLSPEFKIIRCFEFPEGWMIQYAYKVGFSTSLKPYFVSRDGKVSFFTVPSPYDDDIVTASKWIREHGTLIPIDTLE